MDSHTAHTVLHIRGAW